MWFKLAENFEIAPEYDIPVSGLRFWAGYECNERYLMKQVHAAAVMSVFLLIWAVASVLAAGQGLPLSALLVDLSATTVWIVAGGIAVLSAAFEARRSRERQSA